MEATIDLNLVRAFVAVHVEGSFSAAAARLGVPRSTVSRAVAVLEESLGVTLFHRTTRRVSISTAGAALFDRVAPLLQALQASLADLPEREAAPSGTLRITSTVDLGAMVLAEAIARFSVRYPNVRVEAHLTNTVVDLVKEGMDLALRVWHSPLRDSTLVARKVGTLAIHLYASPSYLARRGAPRVPGDLDGLDWIAFRGVPPLLLSGPASKATVSATPRIAGDDMWFLREVIKAGAGIGSLPSFMADADVAAGTLVRVLPRWTAYSGTVYLVHSGRKHLPPKVTAFRELVAEMLRQRPLSVPDDGER
ncbi:LysR family transcriptional regulator [Polyangium sp. y55x31]|uniref:LysR family transcriptional regulator n=1 Tax=Polyangium sp. y55x31 TaxID=3042688 RepID=UPI0024828294|nr:LysR family transcriptional regulator [Polyangium sp. y55x31]MDI1483195.1 LysR family transcriptional regulator [Polyangium sp. y55x31]